MCLPLCLVSVPICVRVCVHVCLCPYICSYLCLCVCLVFACPSLCVPVCPCVHPCVSMCLSLCVSGSVLVCVSEYPCLSVRVCVRVSVPVCVLPGFWGPSGAPPSGTVLASVALVVPVTPAPECPVALVCHTCLPPWEAASARPTCPGWLPPWVLLSGESSWEGRTGGRGRRAVWQGEGLPRWPLNAGLVASLGEAKRRQISGLGSQTVPPPTVGLRDPVGAGPCVLWHVDAVRGGLGVGSWAGAAGPTLGSQGRAA